MVQVNLDRQMEGVVEEGVMSSFRLARRDALVTHENSTDSLTSELIANESDAQSPQEGVHGKLQ